MATTRWKDKALISALADDDNFPVTDTDDTDTDKRATAAKIGDYIGGYSVTLTNKTLDLSNNTLTGTAAEFDTACSDDTFVFTSEVGSVAQAWSARLDDVAGLAPSDGNFIVGDDSNWVAESGATARTSLGLSIGSNVQAWDADLDTIAALSSADGNFIVGSATGWVVESGVTVRSSLGLSIGSDVQAHGDILDDLNTLGAVSSDGEFLVGTGAGAFAYESGATVRASLGLTIGSDVQAFDADTLKADTADVLTAGFAATVHNAGTQSSGTYTPDEANGNFQRAVNGGAHTLAPPTNDCNIVVQYTNNASAGTITTSGFTIVTGDSFDTTDGNDFLAYITKINGFSHLNVVALQ